MPESEQSQPQPQLGRAGIPYSPRARGELRPGTIVSTWLSRRGSRPFVAEDILRETDGALNRRQVISILYRRKDVTASGSTMNPVYTWEPWRTEDDAKAPSTRPSKGSDSPKVGDLLEVIATAENGLQGVLLRDSEGTLWAARKTGIGAILTEAWA